MANRMIYESQVELSAAASTPREAIRKQEFDVHANNMSLHFPPGQVGQVWVMTASGPAWKWPHIVCSNTVIGAKLVFQETMPQTTGLMIQGIDTNVLRLVEIE